MYDDLLAAQSLVVLFAPRKLRLIDWGLAEFYHPGREYNVRARGSILCRIPMFDRFCRLH